VPGGEAAAPAEPALKLATSTATKDSRFTRVIDKLKQSALKVKKHPPAAQKAAQAQAAALPPANEKLAGAQANQVDKMKEAETKKPESDSFLALLRAEIQKVMPKKVEDTEDYMKGDDRKQLKGAMTGNIDQQKAEATSGMQEAANEPPDTSNVPGKEVTPLPGEPAPAAPPPVGAAEAMPAPKPEAEVSLQQSKQDAEKDVAATGADPALWNEANDSRFNKVVESKTAVVAHADAGPQKYRADEQKAIAGAAAQAAVDEHKGLAGFLLEKKKSAAGVKARQLSAKEKDELERKKVTDHIEGIFNRTKATVDKKLESLDTEVTAMFDAGADAAVEKMKKYVEDRFDDRYSGISGKALWLKDKVLPLPKSVKAWFDQAHKVFLAELDALVVRVAKLVETRLQEAKDEIAKGQKEIKDYVDGLPANLQAVGRAAQKEMNSRFDELRQGVDDKRNDLANKLAQRYKDAHEKGQKALQELKDKHKSLYERLRDAIKEVIEVLRNFKNRIVSLIKKGADTINLIVAHPIRFLKNLINAIKQGISQFRDRIWEHLKAGFLAWLLGPLGEAGITMPKDLSLPSILMLVLQILGLTYAKIRAKAVKLIGERNVMLLEKLFELLKALWEGGPAALWEKLKEFLGDLKQQVIDAIQDWVVATIIKAAVTKLVTMFNPVGAIIQAIITIYNVVMFFIERINQILAFVEAVINSVHKIATGAIGDAANWIEKALARTIPLIISFLARLLGISGITQKIISIVKKIQRKVDQAVDKVIQKIVSGIGKLFGKGKEPEKPKSVEETKWDTAVAAVKTDIEKMEKKGVTEKDLEAAIPGWKKTHGFKALAVQATEDDYIIEGSMSPGKTVAKAGRSGSKKNPFKLTWPKPPSSDYPVLYFGGVTGKTKSQPALKGLHTKKQKDDTGTEVKEYHPNQRQKLAGGETIGLTSKYRIGTNTVVGPLSDETTPGGGKILSILNRYGFDATAENLDGDHVREIQFGGDDVVENLWPLNAGINRGAGSTLSKSTVEYPTSGNTIKISELKQKTGAKYYFKITKFSY
jgi:ABC-type multidrug transport system fused ATPase/permease subunit